jgi:4-methyl-5(b-hydroxyethyl)-thiazole monophosphate biosynthesis
MQDDTTNILLFLAQGFEDLEAIAVLDVFAWTRYREHIPKAAVTTTGFQEMVTSRCGLPYKSDIMFQDINPEDYQALVLPGGFHSQGFDEAYDARIHELARKVHLKGGYIATMCVGILPIADAGLLIGKRATTYPYSQNHNNLARLKTNGAIVVDEPVVMDDRIISCGGPGSALEVSFLLMECLMGSKTTQEVRKFMMYK